MCDKKKSVSNDTITQDTSLSNQVKPIYSTYNDIHAQQMKQIDELTLQLNEYDQHQQQMYSKLKSKDIQIKQLQKLCNDLKKENNTHTTVPLKQQHMFITAVEMFIAVMQNKNATTQKYGNQFTKSSEHNVLQCHDLQCLLKTCENISNQKQDNDILETIFDNFLHLIQHHNSTQEIKIVINKLKAKLNQNSHKAAFQTSNDAIASNIERDRIEPFENTFFGSTKSKTTLEAMLIALIGSMVGIMMIVLVGFIATAAYIIMFLFFSLLYQTLNDLKLFTNPNTITAKHNKGVVIIGNNNKYINMNTNKTKPNADNSQLKKLKNMVDKYKEMYSVLKDKLITTLQNETHFIQQQTHNNEYIPKKLLQEIQNLKHEKDELQTIYNDVKQRSNEMEVENSQFKLQNEILQDVNQRLQLENEELKMFSEQKSAENEVNLCQSPMRHIYFNINKEENEGVNIVENEHTNEEGVNVEEKYNAKMTEEIAEIVDSLDFNGNNSDYENIINKRFQSVPLECFQKFENDVIQVYVKELKGKSLKFEIKITDTINSLKEKIKQKFGYEIYEQRLIFQKIPRPLKNERTIKYYNITHNTILYLVKELRGGCFIGNTKVLLSTLQEIDIKNVKIGDKMLTFNLNSNTNESHSVKNILKYDVNELVNITFENGSNIICTASHPFYVDKKRNWCCVKSMIDNSVYGSLCVNDYVRNYKSEMIRITNIEYKYINNGNTITVYTLHLDKIHNFYANGILVHNAMQIFVKRLSGKTYILDVEPNDSIQKVKEKLAKKANISIKDQRLIIDKKYHKPQQDCNWKPLEDNKTLDDYNIQKEWTLQLFTKFDEIELLNINPSKKLTMTIIPKYVFETFDNIYEYMNKYVLFHGRHAMIKLNGGKHLVIDYNFHSNSKFEQQYDEQKYDEQTILYVICDKKCLEWKMRNELYTAQQIINEFKIRSNELPIPMKNELILDWMIDLQKDMGYIENILKNDIQRNKILNIKWNKIPICTSYIPKKSSAKLSLQVETHEFVKRINKYVSENINLILIVNEYNILEVVWIVEIEKHLNIGISLQINKNKSLSVKGIYLKIENQHRIVPGKHYCLNGFNLDILQFGNKENEMKQKYKTLQRKFSELEEKHENIMVNNVNDENEEKRDILHAEELTPSGSNYNYEQKYIKLLEEINNFYFWQTTFPIRVPIAPHPIHQNHNQLCGVQY